MAPPPTLTQQTTLEQEKIAYANWLSAKTGFDPRVILTQMAGEGHPGDEPGYLNWLNIATATAAYYNVPHGAGYGTTATFPNLADSEKAALDTYRGLGLTHEQGKTIEQQLVDIGDSNWASSHYGNPPGSNLIRDFESIYPKVNIHSKASTGKAGLGGNQQPGGVVAGTKSAIGGALGGLGSGIESFGYQALFVIIGLGLILVGLALIAYTLMGKVGAPGVIGMAQSQMRISQAGRRIEESNRASTVRESQAGARLSGRDADRELASRRVAIQEENAARREERYVVKDKPNQVVRNRGARASGPPRSA